MRRFIDATCHGRENEILIFKTATRYNKRNKHRGDRRPAVAGDGCNINADISVLCGSLTARRPLVLMDAALRLRDAVHDDSTNLVTYGRMYSEAERSSKVKWNGAIIYRVLRFAMHPAESTRGNSVDRYAS